MSLQQFEEPLILDSTGQGIITKLNEIKQAVQPTNPCIVIDISLQASSWSNSSPYTYNYTNEHITSGALVKYSFLEGAENSGVLYLNCEKIEGGVYFTAPEKPSVDIPVRLYIENADATSTSATTADAVSVEGVTGIGNVQQAVELFNTNISGLTTAIESTGQKTVVSNTTTNYTEVYEFSGGLVILASRRNVSASITSQSGGIYYATIAAENWGYTFADAPTVIVTARAGTTNAWVWEGDGATATKTPSLFVGRGASATGSINLNYIAIGHKA